MITRVLLLLFLLSAPLTVSAGDDASGPIHYAVDLGKPFTVYLLTKQDRVWGQALAGKLKYKGKIIHLVRTSLPLSMDGKTVEGVIYQAVELPDYFYIVQGDAMLKIGTPWPFNPGVGGFSLYAPRSRNFIICLDFQKGGVPFLSSSPVIKGEVIWKGNDHNRLR